MKLTAAEIADCKADFDKSPALMTRRHIAEAIGESVAKVRTLQRDGSFPPSCGERGREKLWARSAVICWYTGRVKLAAVKVAS